MIKFKKNKKTVDYLKKEKISEKLSDADLELFRSFSSFIIEHDLEAKYSNFYPHLFAAWIKIND